MSQERSKSLRLVLQLAERAETEAANSLRLQRQQLQAQQQQLMQISQYIDEYNRDANRLGQSSVQQMLGQRAFLGQLDQLKETQTQAVSQLDQQTQKAEVNWQQLYQRRQKLEQLIAELDAAHQKMLDGRLQKEMDELSNRMFAMHEHRY